MPRRAGRISRRATSAAAVLLVAGLGYVGSVLGKAAAGYTAKILCSCIFVSKREPDSCLRDDLGAYGWVATAVDRQARATTATAFLVWRARAEFRNGLGCTLR